MRNDENELGGSDRPKSADSQIRENRQRIYEISSKLDDIGELLVTVKGIIQALRWKDLIVISFLLSLVLGYFGYQWLIAPDNRPVLSDILGRSKLVGVVDNCPVLKFPINGQDRYFAFLNYRSNPGESFFVASVDDSYDTSEIRLACVKLQKDRAILLEQEPKKEGL